MLYQQEPFYFVLALLITVYLGFRLTAFLKQYFSSGHAIMVMLAILLNPLSIDALVAPNPLVGGLSFAFFLEAFFMHKKEKSAWALGLSIMAGLLNIGLCLLPLYFFYLHRKKMRPFLVPIFLYIFFVAIYLWKHILISVHNPLLFFGHFITNLIAPLSVSLFDYSINPFSWPLPLLSLIVVLIMIWRQKTDPRSREYLVFLFLPIMGSVFQQWSFPYRFWDEIIQTSSNFMVITFAFVVIMSIHLPKRFFAAYLVFILFFSFEWAIQWFPNSNVLRLSIVELPLEYPLRNEAKRALAWQLMYENKDEEGIGLLNALYDKDPKDRSLQYDLKLIDQLKKARNLDFQQHQAK